MGFETVLKGQCHTKLVTINLKVYGEVQILILSINHLIASLDKHFKIYSLLTKCQVKMAGYWPRSFPVCLYTKIVSRSMKTQNQGRTMPIFSHIDRASLNKEFII